VARIWHFVATNPVVQVNAFVAFAAGFSIPQSPEEPPPRRRPCARIGPSESAAAKPRKSFNIAKNNIYQEIDGRFAGGWWSKPSYFNGAVYFCSTNDAVKPFPVKQTRLAPVPAWQCKHIFCLSGFTPDHLGEWNVERHCLGHRSHKQRGIQPAPRSGCDKSCK
jgi:hypothetical protein